MQRLSELPRVNQGTCCSQEMDPDPPSSYPVFQIQAHLQKAVIFYQVTTNRFLFIILSAGPEASVDHFCSLLSAYFMQMDQNWILKKNN